MNPKKALNVLYIVMQSPNRPHLLMGTLKTLDKINPFLEALSKVGTSQGKPLSFEVKQMEGTVNKADGRKLINRMVIINV